MANESKDQPVLGHIDRLVKEEERLYAQSELTDDDRDRLAKIKVELDQCWDLLRQRRALREFGRDPDQARCARRRSSKTTSSSPSPQGRSTRQPGGNPIALRQSCSTLRVQATSVEPLLLGKCVIHNAVEASKGKRR